MVRTKKATHEETAKCVTGVLTTTQTSSVINYLADTRYEEKIKMRDLFDLSYNNISRIPVKPLFYQCRLAKPFTKFKKLSNAEYNATKNF